VVFLPELVSGGLGEITPVEDHLNAATALLNVHEISKRHGASANITFFVSAVMLMMGLAMIMAWLVNTDRRTIAKRIVVYALGAGTSEVHRGKQEPCKKACGPPLDRLCERELHKLSGSPRRRISKGKDENHVQAIGGSGQSLLNFLVHDSAIPLEKSLEDGAPARPEENSDSLNSVEPLEAAEMAAFVAGRGSRHALSLHSARPKCIASSRRSSLASVGRLKELDPSYYPEAGLLEFNLDEEHNVDDADSDLDWEPDWEYEERSGPTTGNPMHGALVGYTPEPVLALPPVQHRTTVALPRQGKRIMYRAEGELDSEGELDTDTVLECQCVALLLEWESDDDAPTDFAHETSNYDHPLGAVVVADLEEDGRKNDRHCE